ncbi:MAG: helix-turn-helix domain-containing protein [Candidatus Paceibacterota bacterium]|jgi:sugar-specific transcriptional regulator TrmB
MKTDNKEIIDSLELYGFSPNEATVYVFLLKKIESSAFEIAKESGIPRTTVYTTLESLKRQGFVSRLRKNNVAYFTPESPNRLIGLLKKKEEVVNSILPQIRAISSRNVDAPTAKLFVGIDGIKSGLEDILETLKSQKIKQILATSQPDMTKHLPKYFPAWLKSREDIGVFTKLILSHDARGYLFSNELREVRYLPEKFPFDCSVTIYGNKMAFFSLRDDDAYCVIIESRSIADMLSKFFLFSWEMLGK